MSDVRIDVELAHPAQVVWRALTEPCLMSEWFIPTDLAPIAGEVYRAFPPSGLVGFTGPFDVDILEVVEHERMRMRWRGDQLHTEMVWELCDSDPGVSLAVVQSGFLGMSGDQRRTELTETYDSLFREKLPVVLAMIAEPLTQKPPKTKPAESAKHPKHPKDPKDSKGPKHPKRSKVSGADGGVPWWRRLTHIPTYRRGGMLSIVGAMVITGLIASALAVIVMRPPSAIGINAWASYGPNAQAGVQPGVTISPAASSGPARPGRKVVPTVDESGASAEYRASERLQLGYIGAITIKAGKAPINGWSAVVDFPNKATVTSAWDQVRFTQEHRRVTFTPSGPKRDLAAGAQFTFYFQVGDPKEYGKPQGCAVNDLPCAGLGD